MKGKLAPPFKIIIAFPFDLEIPLLGNASDSYYLNTHEMIYVQGTETSVALFLWQKTGNSLKDPSEISLISCGSCMYECMSF